MYLMYVDESGDCGLKNTPTRYFVLTGLVLHELCWSTYLSQLIAFRQRMRQKFGLRLREEIHSAAFINKPGSTRRIKRNDRLTILRAFADELASMTAQSLISIVVDKQGKPENYDVFSAAWKALVQRFENTLSHRNFPGPANENERGMIFADHTDDKKLMQLVRQMRHYNPVPNQSHMGSGYRNLTLTSIVEDPNFRISDNSYFIQAADLTAFLLYQQLAPNSYIRNKSGHGYFRRLEPIFCKFASSNAYGIVWL